MEHSIIIYPFKQGGKREIEVDGILYESKNAMMSALSINENDIYRFKNNHSYEEAISLAIDYRKKQNEKNRIAHANAREKFEKSVLKRNEKRKKMEFSYYGRVFKSFKDCLEFCEDKFLKDIYGRNGIRPTYFHEYYMLNAESIKASAKRNNRDLKEQLTLTLKRKFLNERKIRNNQPKYAFVYFNTQEKAFRYCSYLVSESNYFVGEVDGRLKHVVSYIPK